VFAAIEAKMIFVETV